MSVCRIIARLTGALGPGRARDMVRAGAILVDLREKPAAPLAGALAIPRSTLPENLARLPIPGSLILCADTPAIAAESAWLLNGYGFTVGTLRGGAAAWPNPAAEGRIPEDPDAAALSWGTCGSPTPKEKKS